MAGAAFRSSGGSATGAQSRAAALLLLALALAPAGAARAQAGAGSAPAAREAPAAATEPRGSEDTRAREAEIEAEIARLKPLGEEWAARTAALAQARESAPRVLAETEAEIAELQRRKPPRIRAGLALEELEATLLGAEQDLALAGKEAAELEAEDAGRAERRKQIPELLAAQKEKLRALDAEAAAAQGEPALAEARQRLARARREAIQREIEAYEEELRSYDARGQLLARRRDRAGLRVASLEERVGALGAALSARRQGEAEVAAEAALRSLEAVEGLPPAVLERVRSLAEENRKLALRRTGEDGLLQHIDAASGALARLDEQVADVKADLEQLQRRVEAAGLSSSVGLLLRRLRSDAPDAGKYRRFMRMRRSQISELQLQQLELSDQRHALVDLDDLVEETMAELAPATPPGDRAALEALLRDLFVARRKTLDALIGDTETYFQRLVDFDAREQELIARTESLLRFIDERILWVPSGEALAPSLASDAREALAWLFSPRFDSQLLRALGSSVATAPLAFAAAALLLLAAPVAWPRMRARVEKLGEEASQRSCSRIEPTGAALLLSLLLAGWAPGLLAFLGWRLGVSEDATQYVRCFAQGLLAAALVWASLVAPRQLLRRRGIAEAHLGWPEAPTRDLRRQLGWLAAVAVPASFAIAVFEARGEDAWTESVGRGAFLVAISAVLVFTHLVLREDRGALVRIARARPRPAPPRWAWRLLYLCMLGVALGLAAAALRGYYWTALRLAAALHASLVFLLLLLFAYDLGARWSLLAGRRLALSRLREAREALAAKAGAGPEGEGPAPAEPELDLATVGEHTGRLLRYGALLAAASGLWLIWGDLLPAAGALRSVELWSTTRTVSVESTSAAGERVSGAEQRVVPVTLADLCVALVVAAMALALVRNLPGLLEVVVFRRLPASPGERYAYTTLGKYAVTIAGLSLALAAVGVGWSSIQWMLAALGLGLGFGLQEIFANFVSGLIILFERPIRVGDTVTVGDISGTVTKIRIRATWITAFDHKELVVPNKEFVTSRLVNWTLSDAVLRVDIPVGIAYGSDTDKASRVLLEVAEKNEHVLREPRPTVLFRGFGEKSLSFELRAFSPDVAHYMPIVHELHMEIERAFRAEGIEIAFPQRDLHLRPLPSPPGGAAPSQG